MATALKAAAYAALVLKLLVPVGYMPGALADGSPIKLCGYVAAPPHVPPDAGPHGHGDHARHSSESPLAAGGAAGPEHAGEGHAHDDPTARHDQWERCALGSVASQAAIPAEWPITVTAEQFDLSVIPPAPLRRAVTIRSFRARAPPAAHS